MIGRRAAFGKSTGRERSARSAYIAFTEQDSFRRKYLLMEDRLRIVTRVSDVHAWMPTIKTAIGNPGRDETHVVTNGVYPG
jgi:hypothetical protein